MQKASSMMLGGNSEKQVASRIVSIPGTLGTVMHAIAVRFFGPDIYDWEPETLEMEFQEEFGVEPWPENMERMHAIISSVSSNVFYSDWVAFLKVCTTLSGENDVEDLQEITVEELAWGVIEMSLNDDGFSMAAFSPDVRALVGVYLDENGYFEPPRQLSFAKMPYRYHGDDYGPDINRKRQNSEEKESMLAEYMKDQIITLYKQMKNLPWLKEADFKLVIEAAKEQLQIVQ